MVSKNKTSRSNKRIIAGRYRVKKEIVGGMGIVYLCKEIDHNNHPVVLKTCRPKYCDDRNIRAQFLREAAAWVEIGWHPNIVQAYRAEYVYPTRTIYLVIEMIPSSSGISSPTLRTLLKDGNGIGADKAQSIVLDIVRGMKYATTKIPGLIHCDLKPENIFIGPDGRARVSDFGLVSTPTEIHESLSRSVPRHINNRSRPVGTPYYMSPERWRNRNVSVSSDIYSLGCIYFEMLTGEHAVQGEHIKAIIEAHIRGEALRKVREMGFSPEIDTFLTRCLQTDPQQRYQTWEEVEAGIFNIYDESLIQAAPADVVLFDVSQKAQIALGETMFSIGEAYLDIQEFQAAIACFGKAKIIGKLQNYVQLVAQAEASIGLTFFMLGQPERGIAHYRRAALHQERYGDHANATHIGDPADGFDQTRRFV